MRQLARQPPTFDARVSQRSWDRRGPSGWADGRRASHRGRDLPHVDLDEAAALLVLIASNDPQRLDAAAVRFLGRACLGCRFIKLSDTQLLATCLAQLDRADAESRHASRRRCAA